VLVLLLLWVPLLSQAAAAEQSLRCRQVGPGLAVHAGLSSAAAVVASAFAALAAAAASGPAALLLAAAATLAFGWYAAALHSCCLTPLQPLHQLPAPLLTQVHRHCCHQ
jgi:hypothetical protein